MARASATANSAPGTTADTPIDLNLVSLFVAVVAAGSFTAAGRARGLPKSSVSRAVLRLEDHLGVRLLQRTTRNLGLTAAGEQYLRSVKEPLGQLAEASGMALDSGQAPRGVVRLTTPVYFGEPGFGPVLASFIDRYPHIHLDVTATNRRVNLIEEGIDLAIRAGKLEDSSLIARRVAHSDMGIFGAPAYFARRGRPRRVADLAAHACVLFHSHGSSATWRLSGPRGIESVEVHGPVNVDDFGTARNLALAGIGIGLFPTVGAHTGSLERVLPGHVVRGAAVYVVSPPLRHMPVRVALLRDHLVRELTTLFAD